MPFAPIRHFSHFFGIMKFIIWTRKIKTKVTFIILWASTFSWVLASLAASWDAILNCFWARRHSANGWLFFVSIFDPNRAKYESLNVPFISWSISASSIFFRASSASNSLIRLSFFSLCEMASLKLSSWSCSFVRQKSFKNWVIEPREKNARRGRPLVTLPRKNIYLSLGSEKMVAFLDFHFSRKSRSIRSFVT